jgi:hypothetical protein
MPALARVDELSNARQATEIEPAEVWFSRAYRDVVDGVHVAFTCGEGDFALGAQRLCAIRYMTETAEKRAVHPVDDRVWVFAD